eukprot:5743389-Amphidinium_carterae.1
MESYIDDVHGGLLDANLVRQCRDEEINWMRVMRQHGTYSKVPRNAAGNERIIKVLWVDTNKGDATRPDYRNRLCARETRLSGGLEGMAAQ